MAEDEGRYQPVRKEPSGISMDDLEIRPMGDGLYVITNTSKGPQCCSCWSCSNRGIATPTGGGQTG